MNKDEILAKSREENSLNDPYEMEVRIKASQIGTISSLIICFVLFLIQILAGGGINYGLWGVIMAGCGGSNLFIGIKLKKQSSIVWGICYLLCGVIGAIVSICNMF